MSNAESYSARWQEYHGNVPGYETSYAGPDYRVYIRNEGAIHEQESNDPVRAFRVKEVSHAYQLANVALFCAGHAMKHWHVALTVGEDVVYATPDDKLYIRIERLS